MAGGDSDNHTLYKSLTAAGIFLLAFCCANLPFWIKNFRTNKTLIELSNSLAGGIFLSAGLIHIVPHSMEMWEEGSHSDTSQQAAAEAKAHGFPWITFTMLASFVFILFVDRVLLPTHSGLGHHHEDDHAEHNHFEVNPQIRSQQQVQDKSPATNPEIQTLSKPQVELVQEINNPSQDQPGGQNSQIKTSKTESKVKIDHTETKKSVIAPFAIVLALGVHAFFEGLALGILQETTGFVALLAAVVFHKWAESLAVGIGLLRNEVSSIQRWVCTVLFAILTPVGIILGLLLDDANLKIQAIILAVSGGTFLYISLVEIVAEEFNKSKGRLYRFLAFGVGCGIMILAWYFETLSQKESSGNGEAHDHITANNQVSNVRRLL